MNVYDFDHTVYRGDSSIDFAAFCLKRHPLLFIYLPVQLSARIAIFLGLLSARRRKEIFFAFLSLYPAAPREIEEFWRSCANKISPWYLARQRSTDCIISASPDFLLRPLVSGRWGVRLIATDMSPDSAKIEGGNCKGREKVSRFSTCCPNEEIDEFYSDSLSDAPLARIAKRAFLINLKGGGPPEIHPWPDRSR